MAKQNILTARTEFASALNQVCSERGIEVSIVIETIKIAILAAYRKDYGFEENFVYKSQVDENTGEAKIFQYPKLNPDKELEEGEEPEYDKKKEKEITPPGFGRIASQTAKQVILQKIREAEKSAIIANYEDRIGTLISGMILRRDGQFIIVDIGRGQAIMPPQEQTPRERYSLNRRMTFLITDIRDTIKGRQIIVSRSAAELVSMLFDREVPEVSSGAVEIKKIAREAGERTKLAVISTQSGVDPVGSCVGQKGVRVQTVIDELDNEKIDIIQHSDDPIKFIKSSLAPAENAEIKINEDKKEATVTVPEDQLSLAIGKDGQNVRLAAKLTGYKIDIKGPGGMLTESEKKKIGIKEKIMSDEAIKEIKENKVKDSKKEKVVKKEIKKKVSKKVKTKKPVLNVSTNDADGKEKA